MNTEEENMHRARDTVYEKYSQLLYVVDGEIRL